MPMQIRLLNKKKAVCLLTKSEVDYYDLQTSVTEKQIKQDFVLDIMRALNIEGCNYYIGMQIQFLSNGYCQVEIDLMNKKEYEENEAYANTSVCNLNDEEDYLDYDNYDNYDYSNDKYFGNDNNADFEYETSEQLDGSCTELSTNKDKDIEKEYTKTYIFNKLDTLIKATNCIINCFNGDASLYKNKHNQYILVVNYVLSLEMLKLIHIKLLEFTNIENNNYSENYLKEHTKCIIESDAINILSKF